MKTQQPESLVEQVSHALMLGLHAIHIAKSREDARRAMYDVLAQVEQMTEDAFRDECLYLRFEAIARTNEAYLDKVDALKEARNG